jgi:hypothetical protein
MHVVETGKPMPATAAQIAELEFAAVKGLRAMNKVQRLVHVHMLMDELRAMTVIASEILACEKDELIAKTNREYETFGPCLMELAKAGDTAKAVLNILQSAEMRLAIALANVEGDEEPPQDAPQTA